MSLFKLDTQPPIMDLSCVKLNNTFTPVIAESDDPELAAITNTTNPTHSMTSVKKKRTYKPRTKKDATPAVSALLGVDGILVASFEGENPTDAATQLQDSVHDFSINESLFKPEELELNPVTDVFIKNSRIKNDELVKYYIIKYKICDYNCSSNQCPMKQGIWRRRPAYLILNRKNNKASDLTIPNISLICPNCYVQNKGTDLFNKFRNQCESKCVGCGYPVKKGYELCYVCTEKIKKVSVLSTADDMAELTLRTSTVQPIKVKPEHTPVFGLSTFSTDIDKEIQELGINFTASNISPSVNKQNTPLQQSHVMIDVDAELAKYKDIMNSDMSGQVKTTRKMAHHVPSSEVHYTKHKPVVTPSIANSALNTTVTQELLDQLADI